MNHEDGNFAEDWDFQEKFKDHFSEIARLVYRGEVASQEDDWRRNTDFTLKLVIELPRGRPLSFAARVRRHAYIQRYGRQFTIRLKRPSEAETEMDKLLAGYGDFLMYGFESTPGSDCMNPWFLANVNLLRQYIKEDGYFSIGRNKNGGSWFAAFDIDDMPLGFLLNYEGVSEPDRTAVWGSCRNSNWTDPTRPMRVGPCGGNYVMPMADPYWRQCMCCGFTWRAGWPMS